MNFIVSCLASVGGFFANVGSQACVALWWDEPKCPKSLIK